jgi:hypothetical protein
MSVAPARLLRLIVAASTAKVNADQSTSPTGESVSQVLGAGISSPAPCVANRFVDERLILEVGHVGEDRIRFDDDVQAENRADDVAGFGVRSFLVGRRDNAIDVEIVLAVGENVRAGRCAADR